MLHEVAQLKSKPQHTECDLSKHDNPAACVIAQQYSSLTFFSLRFHSRNVQLIKLCKLIHRFYFFKIA
jgi:hypothetical protein